MSHFLLAPFSGIAYLDGGTGSMLLQAALAGSLSAAYVVKTRWAEFRAFLSGLTSKRAR